MTQTLTQEFAVELESSSTGTVIVQVNHSTPSNLTELTLSFPDYLSIATANGFTQSQSNQCEWDGTTPDPVVRFRYTVDQTSDNGYEFVDMGDWALLRFPVIEASWRYTGEEIEIRRSYIVNGEGITGSDGSIAYLGPHETYQFRGGTQLFTLTVPTAASVGPALDAIEAALRSAARRLEVGGKNDEVVIIAAPSSIDWGWGGLQSGVNGYWVVDSNILDHANNTWLHEYVHTRQEWAEHESTRWLIEGTTNYYAALLTFQQDRISFSEFYDYINTDEHSCSVLKDPENWTATTAHYTKGRRVLGALDAKIRIETRGDRTFQDVFRRMNDREEPLTHGVLADIITDVVGDSLADWLDRYVCGSETPSIPDDEDLFDPDGSAPATPSGTISIDDGDPRDDTGSDDDEDTEIESGDPTETGDQVDECPLCGHGISEEDEFCSECGTALYRECSVCGQRVTNERYCSECGTSVYEKCDVCGTRRHSSENFCSSCGTEF